MGDDNDGGRKRRGVNGHPIRVEDYRLLARRRLPRMVFDYLDGGAEDEKGLRHNRAVFDRWRFVPQRLVDVSSRSLETRFGGRILPMPLAIAPTGLNALFWPQGDAVLAGAAARAGIPFILSTASTMSIEDVARRCDGDRWFQLYILHSDHADEMVARALAADYSTLVITTDVGVNGYRERDLRNRFGLPVRYTLRTLFDGATHPRWSLDLLRHGMPALANFVSADAANVEVQAALMSRQMDASFDWEALARLRDRWPRTLLVKGLLNPQDAKRAVELGADGVILSNHGGRQLDHAVSPMEVLSRTVAVVPDSPVLIDSGFRRGSDVVKALALGAGIVLIGRATLYGLAACGGRGVDDVLRMIRDEIDRTLAQIGCPSVAALSSDYLVEDPSPLSERSS